MIPSYPSHAPSDISWIGDLPSHWLTAPFGSVLVETKVKNAGMTETNLLSLSYGRIVRKDIGSREGLLPESFETYQIVDPGQIVFRFTDLQNDQRSLRSARVAERGIITSAYTSVFPSGMDSRYVAYLMRSYDASKVFYGLGGGVRQSLKFADVARLPVVCPPPAEQRAIADYLDRETARIDALIEEQERLVEMLHERRRSVAHELFGRTVGMCPLKHVTADVTVGIVVNPAAWYVDDGVPALRGLNVRPGYINSSDLVYLSAEGDARHEKSRLRTGDVIVVRTGQAGAASVVPPDLDGVNAIDLLIIRPGPGLDPHFLAAYLNAPSTRSRIIEGSVGAIQGHFNVAALRELPFPALDTTEQRVCAEQWLDKSRAIDTLIAETERFIELSRERRSALITAAVTGHIDVRGEVA